ncbi:AAA family ATPase [Mycetocola reblochoni]|uniref:CobQ/CobB/MinD/ParA nucleotide binding domain-containing protein n=2 Tax=Mycetocola reblochoni TaxID=331618 RepID=A0A1R4K1N3_9MICO|nr:hypothetical protein [Mycetocola reblochoni]RLP70438.1 hypothetical protein D9V30_02720 [Mycetocola reblochoni]SJN38169.1 hypothetical protein FM119_10860 [Mycetocola reblochoni REB411]
MTGNADDRLVIIDAPPTTVTRLSASAAEEGIVLRARGEDDDDPRSWIESSGAAAVIVSEPESIGSVQTWADRAGARLVVLTRSPPLAREGARRGVAVVPPSAQWQTIVEALAEAVSDRHVSPATAGRVTVVWGPTGAPGRSSIAAALAAEFAAAGRGVVLIDADTYGSSQAAALGLLDESAGIAAACRAAARGELDRDTIDRYLERVEPADGSVFWLLGGIVRAARWPELDEDSLANVVGACRDWADEVVIDVGFNLEQDEEIISDLLAPRRNAATLLAIRSASIVVAVAGAEPVSMMRFIRAHAGLVELAGAARIIPVVNRVRWNALGSGPAAQLDDALERLADISDPSLVPYDLRAVDRAFAERGTWRDVAPRSPLVYAIRRLAERIDPALRTQGRPEGRVAGGRDAADGHRGGDGRWWRRRARTHT